MKTIGIIPARFASTRFPGKPLALIHGKTMIERVYMQAKKATSLTEVCVATDDDRIYNHVLQFGGNAVMTSPDHQSGTDRCAEVLRIEGNRYDLVINIQGDEPYIQPSQIDLLTECFINHGEASIATLVKKITDEADLDNENLPKVILDSNGKALYFSRHAIPWCPNEKRQSLLKEGVFYSHIGLYGYRAEVLEKLSKLPRGKLENAESLEQLRWLENGFMIFTALSNHKNMAVDVPGDVDRIESQF